jgi:hypothetical protein
MTVKKVLLAFVASLVVAALVLLPFQLGRHHHVSRHTGVQIGAAVVLDFGVAVVLWLLVLGVLALVTRSAGDRPQAGIGSR